MAVDTPNLLATDPFTPPRPQVHIRQGAKDADSVVRAKFHVEHPPRSRTGGADWAHREASRKVGLDCLPARFADRVSRETFHPIPTPTPTILLTVHRNRYDAATTGAMGRNLLFPVKPTW